MFTFKYDLPEIPTLGISAISCAFPQLFFFFAADSDKMIFLLFDGLSKTVNIAPVVNNTLTLPAPKDSASLLYG